MIININIQEPYFGYILSGVKMVEGRLNKGKFFDIKVGDVLCINNQVNFVVEGKNVYPDFKSMIETEGLKNVIPDAKDAGEAVAAYHRFYSPADENKFGVTAIKISKI